MLGMYNTHKNLSLALTFLAIGAVAVTLYLIHYQKTQNTPAPNPVSYASPLASAQIIPSPTPTPIPSRTPKPSPTPTQAPQISISPAGLEYFFITTLQDEFGGDTQNTVKKWGKSVVTVQLLDNVSDGSRTCVQNTITDFNNLSISTKLALLDTTADISMHFSPRSDFPSLESNYVTGNDGFFWRWYDGSSTIYRANILISTDNPPSDAERCHLIREELTQSMGPANDSNKYADSIFYAPWTSTQSYSNLDQEVIRLLYNPRVKAGMTKEQINQLVTQ